MEDLNLIDGEAYIIKNFISEKRSNKLFEELKVLEWGDKKKIKIFGKECTQQRHTLCMVEKEGLTFRYSGISETGELFNDTIKYIKKRIENVLDYKFNFVLLNYYIDGSQYIGMHSDAGDGPIVALSLGSERKFVFKHKNSNEKIDLLLNNGSLLIMAGDTQKYYKHGIMQTKQKVGGRISLTFRIVKE